MRTHRLPLLLLAAVALLGAGNPARADEEVPRFTNLDQLEDLVKGKVGPQAFDYYRGGSDRERTYDRNTSAPGKFAIRQRVARDVSNIETETELVGTKVRSPFFIAPSAGHGLFHQDAEEATARAAQESGTLLIASTLSTKSLEQIAKANGSGPRWFQLYVFKDRNLTLDLVRRAEKAGYKALVVTVDMPVYGRRERDMRNQFQIPSNMASANLNISRQNTGSQPAPLQLSDLDPSLTWKDIRALSKQTRLPIVVKGVMTAEDARLAVQHGAAGVYVSNHGGRQLGDTVGTFDALPEVVRAVKIENWKRMVTSPFSAPVEVLVDGGIRGGSDVVKAIALGAKGAGTARPIVYGLGLAGQKGVGAVVDHVNAELRNTMANSGLRRVRDIGKRAVTRVK